MERDTAGLLKESLLERQGVEIDDSTSLLIGIWQNPDMPFRISKEQAYMIAKLMLEPKPVLPDFES